MKCSRVIVAAIVAAFHTSLTSFAFDADTLGFYAFRDGDVGSSAVATGSVTNSVVGSAISAATVSRGLEKYDAKFSSGRPGKFIYASSREDAELIAENPQSIDLEAGVTGETGKGSALTFANAGSELSRHHDTGFTVEFFMRMDQGVFWSQWVHKMLLQCGYKRASTGNFGAMVSYFPLEDTRYQIAFSSCSSPVGDSLKEANVVGVIGSFTNSIWHHVALVERPVGSQLHFQTYLDGKLCTDYALTSEVTPCELTDDGYFKFGEGYLTASISCVRFSKRALDADEFMFATDGDCQPAGTDAVAFYAFKEGSAGTSAVGAEFINQVHPGRFPGGVTLDTDTSVSPFARFDDDRPGKYIYAPAEKTLVCTDPGSIKVGSSASNGQGGTLTIENIGTEFSRHHDQGQTVEYFYKVDGNKCGGWSASMSFEGGYCWKPDNSTSLELRLYAPLSPSSDMMSGYCSLGYYTSYAGVSTTVSFSPAPNNGDWHHVALVETREHKMEVYYDYQLRGSFQIGAVRNFKWNAPFKFFCNKMQGKISGLRFTERQLGTSEFLRAYDRPIDWIDQPDLAAFYSFRDGAKGESATGVSLLNDVSPLVDPGSVSLSTAEGANPTATFDDDAPGTAIYGGEEYPEVPFVTNPASVVLDSETTGKSGTLAFPELGKVLYGAHATGYTLEYFFKFVDGDNSQYDPCCAINAGYMPKNTTVRPFHVALPRLRDCADYLYGFEYSVAEGEMMLEKLSGQLLWDGRWHHFACVETPVVDTTQSPAVTNWHVTTWVDYKSASRPYVIKNIANSADLVTSGLELCKNLHHCKYSCLKLTKRPLTRREFMRTTPRYHGMLIIFR